MDAEAFFTEIRRRATLEANVPDPLSAAESFLATSGSSSEGQLLLRLLQALAVGQGSFRRDDILLLSECTVDLAASLIASRSAHRNAPSRWLQYAVPAPILEPIEDWLGLYPENFMIAYTGSERRDVTRFVDEDLRELV